MKERSIRIIGIVLAVTALLAVTMTEQFLRPGYLVKSIVKFGTFLGAILLYTAVAKKKIFEVIRLKKLKKAGILFVSIFIFFAGIAGLFFLLKGKMDLNVIRQSLLEKEQLTKQNCIFAFLYIIVVNSFLEEAFFRGFLFGLFKNKWVGAFIANILFSAYHIVIIGTWFNPFIFILCISGLVAVGLFLQWLSGKFETIAASWLVHASANIAINVIGALIIFEVL